HGTVRVDRVRGRGVEVADGVVGDRCEVDDRLEGGEVVGFDVTDVAGALLVAVGHRSEVATVVPAGVEPDDLVPGLPQERYHHGAEVAPVTGHEYPHGLPLGARPGPPAERWFRTLLTPSVAVDPLSWRLPVGSEREPRDTHRMPRLH